ncbi:hypothetical protein Taro_036297 [Colocasia esculenta]|uniref:Uncharacterized protein n=1 Tax=Colocasia esculenta TaxID=4460 RepID=A0A843W2P7_COLES|nr:hypothetical protein [Colocasia esculenta]
MENWTVAAVISMLISQALLLLFSVPTSSASATPNPTALLLLHLLASYEAAAAVPLILPSRWKRSRLDGAGAG